jgi:PEP-CTERM motif-containing protein
MAAAVGGQLLLRQVVPEPDTTALILSGLLGLAAVRRRQRSQHLAAATM